MATQGQLGLYPILHRPQPQLLQPARLRLQPHRPRHIRIRMTPPQRQCLAQQLRRLRRAGLEQRPGLRHHVLETEGIHLVPGHFQPIPAGLRDQPIAQHGPQTGHVRLKGAPRPGSRLVPPHPLHQRVGRNGATRLGDQQRQHRALLRTPETDRLIPLERRHRPQNQKPHRGTVRHLPPACPDLSPEALSEYSPCPAACEPPLQK